MSNRTCSTTSPLCASGLCTPKAYIYICFHLLDVPSCVGQHGLRKDMVAHFRDAPERDSTVHIRAEPWPRFTMKEFLLEKGLLPGVITKRLDLYGP